MSIMDRPQAQADLPAKSSTLRSRVEVPPVPAASSDRRASDLLVGGVLLVVASAFVAFFLAPLAMNRVVHVDEADSGG